MCIQVITCPTDAGTSCAIYDIAADTWNLTGPRIVKNNHATYCTLSDALVIFAGRAGRGAAQSSLRTAQRYDFASETWTSLKDTPTPRGGMGNCVVATTGGVERAYMFGGEWNAADYNTYGYGFDVRASGAKRMLSSSLRWTPGADGGTYDYMAPMYVGRHGISPVIVNGEVWIVAGGPRADQSASMLTVHASLADLERCA